MENKGLLFIPDISGFTRFVNETEIEHSRLIIQELLETLINTNQIGLEISEIEGDAILFYKYGDIPDLETLYKQVEKMFCEFHKHLIAYDHNRFCQCKACVSTADLTLKVITHYGEFTTYNVKTFNKLLGKDIIVAHQLLKNDIQQHEYWLVTNSLIRDSPPAGLAQWMEWNTSAKQTENGEIPFHYTQLGQLKTELQPEVFPPLELSKKAKVLSVSREYETDIITLFHATGDFTFRSRWQEGVKAVEEINHFLPRVGMRSRFVFENGQVGVYSSSYSYQPDRIEFSETEEKHKSTTYFILEKGSPGKTRFTLSFYLPKNIFSPLLFKLFRLKQLEETYRRSLLNLETLVQEIPSFALPEKVV
ncbi:MAG TPA: DUF2652 domain-containing protein [Puia sp.]|nr:DUF2652 domain-containing protein [Puia sp.]